MEDIKNVPEEAQNDAVSGEETAATSVGTAEQTEEAVAESVTTEQVEEAQAEAEGSAEAQAQASAEEQPKKKKVNLPPALKKLWAWLQAHENIRQMVFFIGFSLICFAIEYITFAVLQAALKNQTATVGGGTFFEYSVAKGNGGLGGFIAFLVSNIIAQICTFILNRKKTFRATNNIIVSGIMYAVLVATIIVLNVWLGGVITSAIANTQPGNKTIETVGGYVGKFTGSFLSFVINFVGCKFLVMRNWGKKKPAEGAEETASETEKTEAVTEDAAADEPTNVTTEEATTEATAETAEGVEHIDEDLAAADKEE